MTAGNLDIRLFDADDDARDLALKQIIQSVISASSTPAQAAAQLDQWMADQTEKAWQSVKDKDIESLSSAWGECPNPRRDYAVFMGFLATVCSAYPPGHASQESLAEFIRELRGLPGREMRQYTLTYNEDIEGREQSIEIITDLWKETDPPIGAFLDESERLDHAYSDIDTPGSETLIRYINFQAFLARLSTSNILSVVNVCSLLNILPSSPSYPDLEEFKMGGPRRIAGHLQAGAPWLATADAAKWLFESARRGQHSPAWNMDDWDEVKKQLMFIAIELNFVEADKELSEKTKALAVVLKDRMDACH